MFSHLSDIRELFDHRTFERGQQYWAQGRVVAAHLEETTDGRLRIEATVRGSEPVPYGVSIALHADRQGRWRMDSHCDCPVARDCKHVVAALLQAWNTSRTQGRAVGKPLPAASPAAGPALPFDVTEWLVRLGAAEAPPSPEPGKRLLYVLKPLQWQPGVALCLYTARMLKNGSLSAASAEPYNSVDGALRSPPRFIGEDDLDRLRALYPFRHRASGEFALRGPQGTQVLAALLASGRLHWQSVETPPLRRGEPRTAHAAWEVADDGSQRLRLASEPPGTSLIGVTPPWYVDAASGECGELAGALEPRLAAALVDAPALPVALLPAVAERLRRAAPKLPPPRLRPVREVADAKPQPRLLFYSAAPAVHHGYVPQAQRGAARLEFAYRGVRVRPGDPGSEVMARAGDELLRIGRNLKAERQCLKQLTDFGLLQPAGRILQRWEMDGLAPEDFTASGPHAEETWSEFMLSALPALIAQGWKAEYDPDFPYRYAEVEEWFGGVHEEAGNDWFGLELGVQVDGQRVNLLPLLVQLLQRHAFELPAAGRKGAPLSVQLPDGRRVALPAERLRPILEVLIELYGEQPLDSRGRLRLTRLDAARLAELQAADALAKTRWLGAERLLELGHKLRDFSGIEPAPVPASLRAQLRPYQRDGLSWLQFLRQYGFGGILADDMGLGKTVQTLAHILAEREAGRMDRPCMVVAPTSLVGNWQREAREFAPGLKVLALQGLHRRQHFDAIAGHDLVITTYPLLPRDKDALLAHEFHLLVLDEAQNIKNAKSQAAQIAQQIKARHRLCLTGTPLENHLGELWSQFHFLQPGLLGDERQFRRLYRTPIEKQDDVDCRARLARRVAPFMLRRTKAQVVKELPPKTEIVRTVALAGAQRDLYETLRLAMHEKVRGEIASRGLGRSQIVILDALLKLRQVCCDPRLVKLEAAKKAQAHSAKLELLMDILPEMLEEGRRVLLFSQFTSMLELIEAALAGRGIRYLKLTGDSRDRTGIVERFQGGEVPLFLVSLKAGGVGLNLTAADTVIHYDPWWNPAVENQATDRAYRIGQDKPVFVYKLIVEGSVEEKIAALQARKAELAAGILGEGGEGGAQFGADDLEALFEPLG